MDKDGETSLDVCRRVSAAVSDEFSAMMLSGKETTAVCSDGKYFLFAGEEALVWDEYEKRPASVLSAPDERKLVWYKVSLEGFGGIVGSGGGKIYYTSGGEIKSFHFCPETEKEALKAKFFIPKEYLPKRKFAEYAFRQGSEKKQRFHFALTESGSQMNIRFVRARKRAFIRLRFPNAAFMDFP